MCGCLSACQYPIYRVGVNDSCNELSSDSDIEAESVSDSDTEADKRAIYSVALGVGESSESITTANSEEGYIDSTAEVCPVVDGESGSLIMEANCTMEHHDTKPEVCSVVDTKLESSGLQIQLEVCFLVIKTVMSRVEPPN